MQQVKQAGIWPARKIWSAFVASLWTHSRDEATKQFYAARRREEHEVVDSDDHLGRKQNCIECRRSGKMDQFENFPTVWGFIFLLGLPAILVVVGWLGIAALLE